METFIYVIAFFLFLGVMNFLQSYIKGLILTNESKKIARELIESSFPKLAITKAGLHRLKEHSIGTSPAAIAGDLLILGCVQMKVRENPDRAGVATIVMSQWKYQMDISQDLIEMFSNRAEADHCKNVIEIILANDQATIDSIYNQVCHQPDFLSISI